MHPCFGKKYFTNVLPNEILTFPVLLFHLSFSSASDLFFLNSPVYVCLFFLFSYRFPYSPFTHKKPNACLLVHAHVCKYKAVNWARFEQPALSLHVCRAKPYTSLGYFILILCPLVSDPRTGDWCINPVYSIQVRGGPASLSTLAPKLTREMWSMGLALPPPVSIPPPTWKVFCQPCFREAPIKKQKQPARILVHFLRRIGFQ